MSGSVYKFKAEVWLYPGDVAWHFISLPKQETKDIEKRYSQKRRGWGSLPVEVTIGKTTWKTSIFPDKKSQAYLLPLKAEIRKKAGIVAGNKVTISLQIKA